MAVNVMIRTITKNKSTASVLWCYWLRVLKGIRTVKIIRQQLQKVLLTPFGGPGLTGVTCRKISIFNGHFPGGPGLADTRMSPLWILLELRMVGDGGNNWSHETCKAPVKSSPPTSQHPAFTGQMPFVPNQQCQSTERKTSRKPGQLRKKQKGSKLTQNSHSCCIGRCWTTWSTGETAGRSRPWPAGRWRPSCRPRRAPSGSCRSNAASSTHWTPTPPNTRPGWSTRCWASRIRSGWTMTGNLCWNITRLLQTVNNNNNNNVGITSKAP